MLLPKYTVYCVLKRLFKNKITINGRENLDQIYHFPRDRSSVFYIIILFLKVQNYKTIFLNFLIKEFLAGNSETICKNWICTE